MGRWLLKTEPSGFSYDDLVKEGKSRWDGVTNNTALLHLRAMKKGDPALIYHSGKEKQIVGLAEIASDPYADPRAGNPRFVVVDIVPKRLLAHPVPLDSVRKLKEMKSFDLVRQTRLSVMPVSEAQWEKILSMSAGS